MGIWTSREKPKESKFTYTDNEVYNQFKLMQDHQDCATHRVVEKYHQATEVSTSIDKGQNGLQQIR